jgi:hypothetical protein
MLFLIVPLLLPYLAAAQSDIEEMLEGKVTEIIKEEYSEIYARLKAVDMLKSAGVFGFIENKKEGGIRKHLIKATSLKREVIYDKVEEENKILQERKETKNPILQKITNTLGSPYVA